MNTKSQSISLLLYVQHIKMTKKPQWKWLAASAIWWQAVKGKTRRTQLQCSCMRVSIFWRYSDFHTLQNKMPRFSKISFFFPPTYIFIKLNFTCVCLPLARSQSVKRALELSRPCFVLVHREETWGKNTNGVQIFEKDRLQFINRDGVVRKKSMKSGKSHTKRRGVCVWKKFLLHCTWCFSNIWNHLEPQDRNTMWQSEQKQSRMTEKRGDFACLVNMHSVKKRKRWEKQHFFFHPQ